MNSVQNPSRTHPNALTAFATNGTAMMIASVAFFSASFILIKAINIQYGLSFWTISLPRFVIGLLMATTLFAGKQRVEWVSIVTRPWMIARGVIGGIGVIGFNLCIVELGAGRTSIITSTYPIFGILIAPIFLPETLRWKTILLSGVAIGGIAIMTGYEAIAAEPNPLDLLAIAIAVASGIVVVAIRKLHNCSNTATIFASQCAYGLAFCLPAAILTFEGISLTAALLTVGTAVSVALGQLLLTQSLKTLSVAKGSSLQLAGPPFVVAGSYLFLGETISITEITGGAIILGACYLIAVKKE